MPLSLTNWLMAGRKPFAGSMKPPSPSSGSMLIAATFSAPFCFFQAEDGIRDVAVTGVQTCALPISAARNGRRAAIVTRVGDDGFGRFCREAVAAFGIDDRYVGVHPSLRTPLAF